MRDSDRPPSQPGELTDRGRQTTLLLGQRLRHLYVTQLEFMPALLTNADMIYLRATPIPRALESLQQTFWGMYPPSSRAANFPPPTIFVRTAADETLFPNDSNCRRFAQLSRAFAQRAADRWNETPEMDYLNELIGKWMPQDQRVAVDSHPRLSGIMDTLNSTLAHPEPTRLPDGFYDARGRKIIDQIACEEWFAGYAESEEYRVVGIGGLVGDIVERMIGSVEHTSNDGTSLDVDGADDGSGVGRGAEVRTKFALSGCHDTTLAALLSSLGAFEGETKVWPPFSSHIAFELFRKGAPVSPAPDDTTDARSVLGQTRRGESEGKPPTGRAASLGTAAVAVVVAGGGRDCSAARRRSRSRNRQSRRASQGAR